MAWVYLTIAGIFEWGWPVGLKLGLTEAGPRWGWISFSVACMAISGLLLLLAQKTIPMGTAYAVWTGIGAVGAFLIGIFFFGEAAAVGDRQFDQPKLPGPQRAGEGLPGQPLYGAGLGFRRQDRGIRGAGDRRGLTPQRASDIALMLRSVSQRRTTGFQAHPNAAASGPGRSSASTRSASASASSPGAPCPPPP